MDDNRSVCNFGVETLFTQHVVKFILELHIREVLR